MSAPKVFADRTQLSFATAAVIALLAAIAMMTGPLAAATRYIPLNYNEGWNAYWADAAMHGQPLYPDAESPVVDNYPPISFFVVGLAGKMIGDNVMAGRLIAVIALFAISANLFLWLRLANSSRHAAAMGAAFFLAGFAALAPQYVGMNDPQLLAHAIMLSGLSLLWRAPFKVRNIIIASVLMLCAGFTKQLLIPLPIALTLWYLVHSRKALLVWLVASAISLSVAYALLSHAYGSQFLQNLTGAREYSIHRGVSAAKHAFGQLWSLLLVAAPCMLLVYRSHRSNRAHAAGEFSLLYLVIAGLIGTTAAGALGVNNNAFFDLLIAACMCASIGIESLPSILAGRWPGNGASQAISFLVLLVASTFVFHAAHAVAETRRRLARLDSDERQTLAQIEQLSQWGRDRHVACELLEMCYWAHLPLELDMFNYGVRLRLGIVPAQACESLLVTGRISVMQLEPLKKRPLEVSRLPTQCMQNVRTIYRVVSETELSEVLIR